MSRIIKGTSLNISNPRVIEIPQTFSYHDNENQKKKDDNHQTERDNIEIIREESEKIISETEIMVKELLEKAREEANIILNDARDEAQFILENAQRESMEILDVAKRNGYQQGLNQANNEIEADRQLALEQSKLIIEEAKDTKLKIIKSSEKDMVKLVLAIAKKIVLAEVQTNPNIITTVIKEAISYLNNPNAIRIYLNPADLDKITESIDLRHLFDVGSTDIDINTIEDDRINQGGCIIESSSGSIDATIEKRIDNIEEAITDVIAND